MVGNNDIPPIKLASLRNELNRQEETIIFALLERAQFVQNPWIYVPGGSGIEEYDHCFMQYMLFGTEGVHAQLRRFNCSEEHSFAPRALLPPPVIPVLCQSHGQRLWPNKINMNDEIYKVYVDDIVPGICKPGDDSGNYGSCSVCDVTCLHALSRRVHYGKFVAEAKYQENPDVYNELAANGNRDGIMAQLRDENQEKRVLDRICHKASTYGQEIDAPVATTAFKVSPDTVRNIYKTHIIPLTCKVEVEYLLWRAKETK